MVNPNEIPKTSLDRYLMEGQLREKLMYNENQQYIHYEKDLFFYAHDFIESKKLNAVLSSYIQK
jgi:hypothetical protein